MIKFFRKDYIMKRYSNYSISIFEKKKGIYIVDSFLETDEKVVINYENYFYKRDYYYFQNNVMPKNYKKYDNWNYKNSMYLYEYYTCLYFLLKIMILKRNYYNEE